MLFNLSRSTAAFSGLRALTLVLCGAICVLIGCGRGSVDPTMPQGQPYAPADASDNPLLAELQAMTPRRLSPPDLQPDLHGMQSLPGFKDLEGYGRSASVTGPGYQPIAPQSYLDSANAGDDGPDNVILQAVDGLAFGLYALDGFRDSMFPTSLKVTLAPGTEGPEYYVAFADYHNNRWVFSGPFTADAEVPIPFSDQPKGLLDFVSPGGSCFFAILRGNPNPDPDPLILAGLELGVDGGTEAPRPPLLFGTSEGAAGIWVNWLDSPDSGDADFLGYFVERAPLLGGNFESISGPPSSDHYFWDKTGLLDVTYRYRVGAVDTSGNKSYSFVIDLKADSAEVLKPIAVLKIPEGPFTAPATIHFDLSESFDPNGGAIDNYEVQLFGQTTYNGPDSEFDIIMQPGCYLGNAVVSVGAEEGSTFFDLKVYPQWGDTDKLVMPATGTGYSRLSPLRAGRLPGSGATVLLGWDEVANGLVIRTDLGNGNWGFYRQPYFPGVDRISEPVAFGDYLAFGILDDTGSVQTLLWDGSTAQIGESHDSGVTVTPAVVSDGGRLLLVYADDNMGQTDLRYVDAINGNFNSGPVLVANAGAVNVMDCVYNPSANSLETLYYEGANVRWQSYDLSSDTENTNDIVAMLAGVTNMDAELDPASGEPAVAFHDGPAARWSFSRHSGAGWSAPIFVDNANDNSFAGDLLYDNGVCHFAMATYGGTDPMQIYNFDPGIPTWNLRGGFELLNVPGAEVALLPGASASELLVAQVDGASFIHLHSCLDDDSETETLTINPESVQGLQLSGVHGSDGLHVLQMDLSSKPDGAFSTDGGSTWTPYPPGPAFATSIDLGAQGSGEVYVTANNAGFGGDYDLFMWDPNLQTFNMIDSTPFGVPDQWPSLTCSRVAADVYWTTYDEVLGELHGYHGNSGGAFTDDITMPLISPIWNSCRSGFSIAAANSPYVLAGGMAPYEGVQGYFLPGAPDFQLLTDSLLLNEPPADFLTNLRARGRSTDCAAYLTRPELFFVPYDLAEVYVSSFGSTLDAFSFERSIQFGGSRFRDIHMPVELTSSFSSELTRTVSVAEANGPTAVSLVSTLDGAVNSFQWSNMGNWEDLPLPQIEHMSMPELIVGMDGRWHLVYHDYLTDEIKVRSTL